MKNHIIISLVVLSSFLSYGMQQISGTYKEIDARVVSMRKLSAATVLGVMPKSETDTIQIVSYSSDFYDQKKNVVNRINTKTARKIMVDSVYHFVLYKPTQFRADSHTLKMMVVIGKDTVWQGFNSQAAPYFAKNCRGDLIAK